MKKFEILEHTADLKIRAFGRNKQELFGNALKAMQQALRASTKSRKAETKVAIRAENLEALLIEFLSEINYLNEVEGEVYFRVSFSKLSDNELEAELFGEKVRRFGLQIKGVTWHGLEIEQNKKGAWQAEVLFDI